MPPSDTKAAPAAPAGPVTEKRDDGRTYEVKTTVSGAKLETVVSVEKRHDVIVGRKA